MIDLSVDDLTNIISRTKASTGDQISLVTQLFSALGDNVRVSGSTVRQALSASDIPIEGALADLVSKVQEIAKVGNRVAWTNVQQIESVLNGTRIQLKTEVTFNVVKEDGLPAFTDIVGISVHGLLWLDIRSIQLKTNGGKKIVRVVTSAGKRDIPLDGGL
ncbi:MAG: hypothetical protein JWN74_1238 [Acidobacteriaceae bacterium]|nr:hypothetical protein [Acidobacteriaceae bacterium]